MPVRIYDISKKLGLENKEVLAKAKELGIVAARVASSTLDKITAEYLEDQLRLLHPERAIAPTPPPQPVPPPPTEPPRPPEEAAPPEKPVSAPILPVAEVSAPTPPTVAPVPGPVIAHVPAPAEVPVSPLP